MQASVSHHRSLQLRVIQGIWNAFRMHSHGTAAVTSSMCPCKVTVGFGSIIER